MAEVMREVTEAAALEGVGSLYPGVRKVTVNEVGGVAYVFTGRSRQAIIVTGNEFEALVAALPAALPSATAGDGKAQEALPLDPAAPKGKRGKSEKAAE